MAARRRKPAQVPEEVLRVRHLIALDATNVMRRLDARVDEMVSLFSRLRDRTPMLETIRSSFATCTFHDLTRLTIAEQSAVNAFYESLAELRWYLSYTEEMPQQVRKNVTRHHRLLQSAYLRLLDGLGAPSAEAGPVVDSEVIEREVPALVSGAPPRPPSR